MDAMALVRKYGKPDIFLTMTCNPNWDEINRELYPGQTPQDRPDLVVRVFRAKLEELQKDILGKVKAHVYVVEFQKRGLPHAHFLLIMEGRFMPRIPLCPSDDEMFPFHFKRKQFHVRLSFAMTVNKAQGQTIPNVDIYLPESVFSHGKLYVALSRSTARKNVKILVIPDAHNKEKKLYSKQKEAASCQYLHEEHHLEGDLYIVGFVQTKLYII
ncbi:hypothetical protein QYE76_011379 [Lolium multiflorum]|uniref:Helitron helicase-like domain-containing protein n=1 Tax=Lolium multiflorum TaxID=4521 RepID=A0AAD8X581_LOLMU|nr:hypothetical protein QYE76_011379 [Lolium multiflorum]